ncbi:MAG: hypothetical protein IPM98_11565 [Lewinellaceae bacterium]|nr:hypothetical protein [Lewinellaceae bacterium]
MPTPAAPFSGDYASEWNTIDSLEKQGLFKSALERTEALHTRAKADRNGPQTIKTLLFRGKYSTMLEEDGFVKAVQILENEEKPPPSRNAPYCKACSASYTPPTCKIKAGASKTARRLPMEKAAIS